MTLVKRVLMVKPFEYTLNGNSFF